MKEISDFSNFSIKMLSEVIQAIYVKEKEKNAKKKKTKSHLQNRRKVLVEMIRKTKRDN